MEAYKKQWEFLKNKYQNGNLGHAYIFSGQDETGKNVFVTDFVKLIHCLKPSVKQEGCGQCQHCRLIEKNSFPDVMEITSGNSKSSLENEKDMMEITIEQIRDVQNFLAHTSYYGGCKTVIVYQAERLTQEAQNCFLKNLEEPKGKTLIMLIPSKAELLLPTITSRCQEIKCISGNESGFSAQENTLLQPLLAIINGDLAQKFSFVKQMDASGEQVKKILETLQKYFRNILLYNIGVIDKLPVAEGKTFTTGQVKKIIRLIETINFQTSITNANPKLALEILFMEI